MHSLLKRQLQKYCGNLEPIPPEWGQLVEAVGKAYGQFDDDRRMLERALDLSSHELVQANSQMQAVFDAFPDLFFLINGDGKILDFKNGSQSRDWLPVAEIVGRQIQNVPFPEAGVQFLHIIESLRIRRDPVGIEYSLKIWGQLEHYEARALPLPDEKAIIIVRNISVRKRAEKALENARALLEETVDKRTSELRHTNESLQREIVERQRIESTLKKTETKFRTLVEQLPTVIYITDAQDAQSWRYVSPQIEAVLGFTPKEWVDDPRLAKNQLHPEDRERVVAERAHCLQLGAPFECEYRIAAKDGRYAWCRDQASLVCDEESGEKFFQGVMLDITERKILEDQLRQSMKLEAIGRLAGGIAHDFNNILTAIMVDSHIIRELINKEHPASEYTEGILASAQRAASLTQQLLAYSRKQTLQPKVFDVSALVANLKGMLQRLIGEHIELETSTCGAAFVRADPGQIEQVIINLLVNARDAMPDGGKVTIGIVIERIDETGACPVPASGVGDYVRITVRDTGIGISEQDLTHLFEPFFTTKAQGEGTGLGLATSYGIIKQSGGSITVESRLNHGTTFKILLQKVEREEAEAVAPPAEKSAAMPGGKETLLVVEDEPMVRMLASEVLRKLGYKVLEAVNGEEAVRIFNEAPAHSVRLLLTDMVMPRLGGKELAERLRAKQPDLQVIYMSGYAADNLGNNELLAVGTGFLQKPFTPSSLAKKVREGLSQAQA
jgi:PAS domain S-box-containing protein